MFKEYRIKFYKILTTADIDILKVFLNDFEIQIYSVNSSSLVIFSKENIDKKIKELQHEILINMKLNNYCIKTEILE